MDSVSGSFTTRYSKNLIGVCSGKTALHLSILMSHVEVTQYLVALPEVDGTFEMICRLYFICCLILVNKAAKRGDTALHFAAKNADIGFLKAVLSHPDLVLSSKNQKGETALDIATKEYHEHHVELIQQAMKDPSQFTVTYAEASLADKKAKSPKKDGEQVNNRDTEDRPPPPKEAKQRIDPEVDEAKYHKEILNASSSGNLGRVINLADKGTNINIAGSGRMFGSTPMHFAALKGHVHIVKYLLRQKGIDANLQNKSGNTAVHFAVEAGNAEILKMLIAVPNVDLSIKNSVSFLFSIF